MSDDLSLTREVLLIRLFHRCTSKLQEQVYRKEDDANNDEQGTDNDKWEQGGIAGDNLNRSNFQKCLSHSANPPKLLL
jgi:hypothetical protein